ncbi:SKP1-like protein 5 [Oryza brachyantha]|uniref:SKP1-like protein n=1 Tax=Oryza brachyantha TaxID=4533 RepID=J3LCR6_ORYBR|nr:SKP1-like protein 5 [Oryza brachyantha]
MGTPAEETTSSGSTTILLVSSDGRRFEVAEVAASMSRLVSHMIEDGCAEGGVPLPNVTGDMLAKIVEYCNKHAGAGVSSEPEREELKKFDADLVNVDLVPLFELIMAANFMDIQGLLDTACQKVADMMKGMTVEQIRETFNIANDLTPEEEAAIRQENAWAFD